MKISITSNVCLSPKILSFSSWAGVTFKQPVPNSKSTYSSSMIGITRLQIGTIAFLPLRCLKRGSVGLIQIAESPKIVSGRVVAIVKNSSLPSILYFI